MARVGVCVGFLGGERLMPCGPSRACSVLQRLISLIRQDMDAAVEGLRDFLSSSGRAVVFPGKQAHCSMIPGAALGVPTSRLPHVSACGP